MIYKKSCLLLALILLLVVRVSVGQGLSCEETLTKARESFEEGHLYGIPSSLKPCIDNGFDKSQRIQAYLLLTRTYLLIDDPISAEDSYLKLLKLDPEYNIDEERDPVDIVYLSKKFTTTPIFVLFGKVGFNLSTTDIIQNFGTDNTLLTKENYTYQGGFQIAGGSELNISDHFSLGLELMFSRNSYAYKNSFFNNDEQTLKEIINMAKVPVYLKYRLKFNKIMPFAYVGYSTDFIITSQANLKLIDRLNSENSEDIAEFPVTGPNVSLRKQRNFHNASVILGIGSNYRIGYNYLTLDLRYSAGLTNIVNTQNQYANTDLLYKYAYVDDYKRLNSFSISLGYVHPLYKPRKKSDKPAKGFFKKLFKR